MSYDPICLDLRALIDANLELYTDAALEKEITLISSRKKSLSVVADHQMADMIIRNLVNNAIKFTANRGSVTVNAKSSGNWAEITVQDTGVGMSENKVLQLFQLGEHVSTTGTLGETGTGLGLQLCKELVEKQGGRIWAESIEGKGSSFHVSLPLKAS